MPTDQDEADKRPPSREWARDSLLFHLGQSYPPRFPAFSWFVGLADSKDDGFLVRTTDVIETLAWVNANGRQWCGFPLHYQREVIKPS